MSDIQEKYSLDTYNNYREKLRKAIVDNSSDPILNDSPIHAAMVMGAILDHSKEVSMYCGRFAIFRDDFKKIIDDCIKKKINVDKAKFDPLEDLRGSLKTFLEKGGYFEVVLERNEPDLKNEPIWGILESYLDKQVKIRLANPDAIYKDAYHFFVGDRKMYRRESDPTERTAICCFNNVEKANVLLERFDQLVTGSRILYS